VHSRATDMWSVKCTYVRLKRITSNNAGTKKEEVTIIVKSKKSIVLAAKCMGHAQICTTNNEASNVSHYQEHCTEVIAVLL
jgi:hypothetical protein